MSLNSHRNPNYSPPVISSNKGWTWLNKKDQKGSQVRVHHYCTWLYNNLVYISWVALVIKQFLVVNPAYETLISVRFIFRLRWVILFDVYYMYTYDAHNDCISWVPPCCTKSGFRWTSTKHTKQNKLTFDPVLCPPAIEGICGPHPANYWARHKKSPRNTKNTSFSRFFRTLFIPGAIEGSNPYV